MASDASAIDEAVALAARLVTEAAPLTTPDEARRGQQLSRLVEDEAGRRLTLALTDEVLRIRTRRRAAQRLADLVAEHGAPSSLPLLDRLSLQLGARLAPALPWPVVPLAARRIRQQVRSVVVPAEEPTLTRHLEAVRAEGSRVNLNVLGEAVLGHGEAARRLAAVLAQVRRSDVGYASVKLSSICAQLQPVAFDDGVTRASAAVRRVFDQAAASTPPVFVNLDMEEYRDLELTTSVFRRVLDEAPYEHLDAGIVLQAYLPDSHAALDDLCQWARRRHERTGAVTKVRLVKGANLAVERAEAELHGWPQAPYGSKPEVDASYKRLLDAALAPENDPAVRVGLASHNLFDVAWGLVRARHLDAEDRLDVEMLTGMAAAQARAVGNVILYTPVVRDADLEAAISYLARRLDENAAPENFLRHLLALAPGTPAWDEQRDRFAEAVADRTIVSTIPRRGVALERPAGAVFTNEPDTDVAVAEVRERMLEVLRAWRPPGRVSPVVDGEEVDTRGSVTAVDPSTGAALHTYGVADLALVDRTVVAARAGLPGWSARPAAERRAVLDRVADVVAERRFDLLATMAHDAGKTLAEGDPEVSEAIDFARSYGVSAVGIESLAVEGVAFDPLGVVVVAAPWNFPLAIPLGGVVAALAAGNTVVLKPAPETVLVAAALARACWDAGVPADALHLLPCEDGAVGRHLITHPGVDGVILTGAHATAMRFLSWRLDLHLLAETSGKNAMVITEAADLDAAVRDLAHSAFSHAGQKCSATSLAIVEASVYDDPRFRRQLDDAVTSLAVGASTDPATVVGPLIRPPEGPLSDALLHLDEGEEWLVAPASLDAHGLRWRPGVKLGVRPGSTFHLTEVFGPVLGVMRADDLDHAVALQNAPPYGLTGGIHSLDPAEVRRWLAAVEVGNAYVNRTTTGAVVRRQPFGGWKRSSVGPTAKAGGPDYVASLGWWRPTATPTVEAAAASYADWWERHFALEHDPTGLRVERNVLRYRPLRHVVVRVDADIDEVSVALVAEAARVTGTSVELSVPSPRSGVDAVVEDDDVLAARLVHTGAERLRYLGEPPTSVLAAAHRAGITVDRQPVVGHGRVELFRWVREQAVALTAHRYGTVLPASATRLT
ncbi:MAG TPA: bifunctional proline dehydrogenase/L-glutamate gamma-semialdehyde dehydrogenase [Acidimicrobiales bacterium]|nr:bifunctional proline dehydrogenase/L-glutamate gamma-semialdehyde dehydrogenase [Acidimicrobiales bacterium]